MFDLYVSRVDIEFSVGWMAKNPELFLERHNEFVRSYPKEHFTYQAEFRPHFITLVAVRKPEDGITKGVDS